MNNILHLPSTIKILIGDKGYGFLFGALVFKKGFICVALEPVLELTL